MACSPIQHHEPTIHAYVRGFPAYGQYGGITCRLCPATRAHVTAWIAAPFFQPASRHAAQGDVTPVCLETVI
ncbi:MAG: hypothetical protein QM579_04325 [Desulfovibrio sp.]|uniref:hypothetical protein n=1 Tax=Desulfovibrio sp. TaxID=885 RepID=UPI0039E3864E